MLGSAPGPRWTQPGEGCSMNAACQCIYTQLVSDAHIGPDGTLGSSPFTLLA